MLKKEKLAIIRKWYSNAITTIDSVSRLIDFIEDTLELEPAQVMLAVTGSSPSRGCWYCRLTHPAISKSFIFES